MTQAAMHDDAAGVVLTMPFGRYKGRRIGDLPDLYLRWLTTVDDATGLRQAVDAELERRQRIDAARPVTEYSTRQVAADIIDAGFRSLARRHHPDVGGSHEAMLKITAAADFLRKRINR